MNATLQHYLHTPDYPIYSTPTISISTTYHTITPTHSNPFVPPRSLYPSPLPTHILQDVTPVTPTNNTVIHNSHLTRPIRLPTFILCENSISFTDPIIPNAHIHRTTPTPASMRSEEHNLYHSDTIFLRDHTSHLDPFDLFLNEIVINQTLHILHYHSPFAVNRHVLSSNFLKVVK